MGPGFGKDPDSVIVINQKIEPGQVGCWMMSFSITFQTCVKLLRLSSGSLQGNVLSKI